MSKAIGRGRGMSKGIGRGRGRGMNKGIGRGRGMSKGIGRGSGMNKGIGRSMSKGIGRGWGICKGGREGLCWHMKWWRWLILCRNFVVRRTEGNCLCLRRIRLDHTRWGI